MPARLRDVLGEIRRHKFFAIRAVVIGWAAVFLLWTVLALRLGHIDNWLFVTGLADIRWFWRGGTAPFSHLLIGGVLNAIAGWLVGRLHRSHKVAMVSAFSYRSCWWRTFGEWST